MYSQEKTNEEETEGPVSDKKDREGNWTGVIILAMLGLMLIYAVHCPTEMTPEIMGYLIMGIQTIRNCREQKIKKNQTVKNQEAKSKEKIDEKIYLTPAGHSGSQAPSEETQEFRTEPLEKSRGRSLDAEYRMC